MTIEDFKGMKEGEVLEFHGAGYGDSAVTVVDGTRVEFEYLRVTAGPTTVSVRVQGLPFRLRCQPEVLRRPL